MRKTILYLFVGMTLITCQISSQSTDSVTNKSCLIIKTDLLTTITNFAFYRPTVTLTAEVCFPSKHSIQFTGLYGTYYLNADPLPNGSQNIQTQKRTQIIMDDKCFWKRNNNFKGFYSGLYLRLIKYVNNYFDFAIYPISYITPVHQQVTGIGGGAIVGYQTYIKKHLVFDFLFGLGVRNAISSPTIDNSKVPLELRTLVDADVRTTMNIGYRF